MECNITFGFKCESAETHSCNATIAKGLSVWNNSILASHNLSNATGNRNMLVLMEKVTKGEKLEPDGNKSEATESQDGGDNTETENGPADSGK